MINLKEEDVSLFFKYKIMTQLTHNIRTHIVYIKTIDWKWIEEIQITKEQYNIISEDIRNLKYNEFYTITDIDTWIILFEWQRWDITRFKEKRIDTNSNYNVVCDYWNRHTMINWEFKCDCQKKYWFTSTDLKLWAQNNNKTIYMQNLTEEDKRECRKYLKSKSII